jgi:hypothetical protein
MISSDPRRASTASLRSNPCVSEISPILFTASAMAYEVLVSATHVIITNVVRILSES